VNLKEYVDKYKTPHTVIAKQMGVSSATIANILKGKDYMFSIAAKISAATNYEVTLEDLAKFLNKDKKNPKHKYKKQGANDKDKI
jgi:transcriptional regulator with XRE-family HTH domain